MKLLLKKCHLEKKMTNNLPWWRNSEKALRKLNKSEAEQKNELLSEKTKAVQAQVERAETVKKISDEIEKTVKQNDKNKALIKRRQRQDFNDYKGNLAKTNGFSKIAGYNSEKEILNKYFISEIKKEQNGEQANVPNSVLFFGPTGNGKTTFAKSLCKALDCKDNVCSPTFAIVNVYLSPKVGEIYHFDFYRLEDVSEAVQIGTEEYFYSGSYCFLEWSERVLPLLPEDVITIKIDVVSENERLISVSS